LEDYGTNFEKIERGSQAWYGGIKKYEETSTSQHDISGNHRKRISSSTMRPREGDLQRYNFAQTNETLGNDLITDYSDDHRVYPHHEGIMSKIFFKDRFF